MIGGFRKSVVLLQNRPHTQVPGTGILSVDRLSPSIVWNSLDLA
jgi:hypothetical protein